MDRLLRTQFAAQYLVGAVGDHLVEVHVGLGAGSGMPNHKWKMIVEFAVNHFARSASDGGGAALVERSEFTIGQCGGELDDAERVNDRDRHPVLADAEILPGALGLGAPIAVDGNVDRAEAVGLGAGGFWR